MTKTPNDTPSPQQLAVLLALWDGLTVRQIARRVGLSPITVKNYLSHLYHKLDAPGQVQLVRKALELGILRVKVPPEMEPVCEMEVPG